MKKVIGFIAGLILGLSAVFAYEFSAQDQELLEKVYEKVDELAVQNMSKLQDISEKLELLLVNNDFSERVEQFLLAMQEYINDTITDDDDLLPDSLDDLLSDDDTDVSTGSMPDDEVLTGDVDTGTGQTMTGDDILTGEVVIPQDVCAQTLGDIVKDFDKDTMMVNSLTELDRAIKLANASGDRRFEILIKGDYTFSKAYRIRGNKIIIRSYSGKLADAKIQGKGMSGGVPNAFIIEGDDVMLGDMDIGEFAGDTILLAGTTNVEKLTLHNLRIYNTGNHMIRSEFGTKNKGGLVQCSTFEYLADQGPTNIIGALNLQKSKGWVVSNNVFKNFHAPDSELADYTVHFYTDSQGADIHSNTFVNCDQSIGLGKNSGDTYTGGMIRNNFVYDDMGKGGAGIGLYNAVDTKVIHNTILMDSDAPYAILYKGTKDVLIANNLTNKPIVNQADGQAILQTNYTGAHRSWFFEPETGDLHLKMAIDFVMDQGTKYFDFHVDIDRQVRDDSPDIGADEFVYIE